MVETECEHVHMPLIGDDAPSFTAVTTQGEISFPEDYKGKWVILFSHPADFTPVCTTEFITFASMQEEFRKMNTELIGLSIDSIYSHIAWLRRIEEKIEYKGMKNVEVKFPVIADLKMEVARNEDLGNGPGEEREIARAQQVPHFLRKGDHARAEREEDRGPKPHSRIQDAYDRGKPHAIVVVAEGAEAVHGQRAILEPAEIGHAERLGGVGDRVARGVVHRGERHRDPLQVRHSGRGVGHRRE